MGYRCAHSRLYRIRPNLGDRDTRRALGLGFVGKPLRGALDRHLRGGSLRLPFSSRIALAAQDRDAEPPLWTLPDLVRPDASFLPVGMCAMGTQVAPVRRSLLVG